MMAKLWISSALLPDFAAEHAATEENVRELVELFAKLGALPEADAHVIERGRARLLAAVSGSSNRFQPLFGKLTTFFDLSGDDLRAVFERAADPAQWQPGPLPWVSLFHLQGGPRVAALDVGLVRIARGTLFPRHRHTASERVMVLEGGYYDHEQRWYGPGDMHEMAARTEHALCMVPDQDVLLAVILSGEIEILAD